MEPDMDSRRRGRDEKKQRKLNSAGIGVGDFLIVLIYYDPTGDKRELVPRFMPYEVKAISTNPNDDVCMVKFFNRLQEGSEIYLSAPSDQRNMKLVPQASVDKNRTMIRTQHVVNHISLPVAQE